MRARNIKPAFFKNECIADLDPFDRLLFIGLWCMADREGRLEDRPKRIKMELFPCDDYNVESGLSRLQQADGGLITRYESCGFSVIAVTNFLKHQNPHSTEADSSLPSEDGIFTKHPRNKNKSVNADPLHLTYDEIKNNSYLTVTKQLRNGESTLHNALIPDSLIPDSLIPDSLILNPPKPPCETPKKKAQDEQEIPEFFKAEWDEYVQMRKEKRSKLTPTTVKRLLKKLAQYSPEVARAMLLKSVEKGWTGVFGPEDGAVDKNTVAPRTAMSDDKWNVHNMKGDAR